MINLKEEDAKTLNKHLQWQRNHFYQGFHYVQLDITIFKLIVFIDALFANNFNLTSQIRYVTCLANAFNKANIIYLSSIKCKRVSKSVLALEFYAMIQGFDVEVVIKSTTKKIFDVKLLLIIIYIDSKLLYDYLVKLGSI